MLMAKGMLALGHYSSHTPCKSFHFILLQLSWHRRPLPDYQTGTELTE